MKKELTCCICGKLIDGYQGCNPAPLAYPKDEVCCKECYDKFVTPINDGIVEWNDMRSIEFDAPIELNMLLYHIVDKLFTIKELQELACWELSKNIDLGVMDVGVLAKLDKMIDISEYVGENYKKYLHQLKEKKKPNK